ncbi:MAG: class I SAM-dependent methyltransferase [Acidimicrobiia bacterium]|jgi:SAM-dependent methyltransferase
MGTAGTQGALWGAAAEDWARLVEPLSTPLYEAALDAAGVGAGTALLDAGCGSGLVLELAQQRGATVSGLDASGGLLAVARRRVPDGELRQGELEELPFGDGSFDVVTAFNAVQYAAEPVQAARELRRVTAPGGQVVVASWGVPDRCESRVVLAAVGSLLPPPPPGTGGPFALAAPGRLEELLEAAGLTAKHAEEVTVAFRFDDLDHAVLGHLSAGPSRRAVQEVGPEAVEQAIREALAASLQPDGSSVQHNAFRFVVATV